jgi:hypothetical protein
MCTTAHPPMALWPRAEAAWWSSSRAIVEGVSMQLVVLSRQRSVTEKREFRSPTQSVTVSGADSADARRKRAKYQGMQKTGMGTDMVYRRWLEPVWLASGSHEDEAGRGRTTGRECTLFSV